MRTQQHIEIYVAIECFHIIVKTHLYSARQLHVLFFFLENNQMLLLFD